MTRWPTHLITPRTDKPLTITGHVPNFTACGIRVYRRTWRGWDTYHSDSTVSGMWCVTNGVDCARCMQTKLFTEYPKTSSDKV